MFLQPSVQACASGPLECTTEESILDKSDSELPQIIMLNPFQVDALTEHGGPLVCSPEAPGQKLNVC